jgi:hypothetical protein
MRASLALFAAFSLLAGAASAAQVTVTLDTLPTGDCYDPWQEADLTMQVVETTADDYTGAGYCVFLPLSGGIWLGGSRLSVDLRTLVGIESVEIDIQEGFDPHCTRAWLYQDDAVLDYDDSDLVGVDLLTLAPGGGLPTELIVSGHECGVFEIRIIGDGLTPTAPTSWGTVKALY